MGSELDLRGEQSASENHGGEFIILMSFFGISIASEVSLFGVSKLFKHEFGYCLVHKGLKLELPILSYLSGISLFFVYMSPFGTRYIHFPCPKLFNLR